MSNEQTAHGYTTRIDAGWTEDAFTVDELRVPAAAHIEYEEGDDNFMVMVGKSPVDGRMVIHVDAAEALPLARIYLNDTLIHGEEASR